MRTSIVIFLMFFCGLTMAQEKARLKKESQNQKELNRPPLPGEKDKKSKPKEEKISIVDYKIINFARDTTFLDTTLSIKKEYKYNYLRKDNFELLAFSNVGQTYNSLGVTFTKNIYPGIGAAAKHFNYMQKEDINYYNVPTPTSDMFFKTTFEQGQLLDALLTFNTSRRLNFSIAYKGMRSLGKYQHIQASTGNFRFTSNYETANKKYRFRAHFLGQDLLNEENGGIADKTQFESKNVEFKDRSRMDVLYQDANNNLEGKQYFIEQEYEITRANDTLNRTSLFLGHQLHYETKFYQFEQKTANENFGDAFLASVFDNANLKTFFNQTSLRLQNKIIGELKPYANFYRYNYYFDSTLKTDAGIIGNQLNGFEIALGATWKKRIGAFGITGNFVKTLNGDIGGDLLEGAATYNFNANNKVKFGLAIRSKMPNFNYLLYQSSYENYNWQNDSNFKKENVSTFNFTFNSKLFGDLDGSVTNIDNFTYFKTNAVGEEIETAFIKPTQASFAINYLKLKYSKDITLGKFTLHNTLMYQEVTQDQEVLNVPQFVTRNSLVFSSHVFKKAMFLQVGATVKYFTEYKANAYNPVLGEFYSQEKEEIGGFPMIDFFINAKVQQMRLYLKAEHLNSGFSENNFYSAPNYPYRDFVIRFGLVWNFFS